MSKLFPRRWGNKLELSGDPQHPVQLLHKEVSVGILTNAQRDALIVFCNRMLEDEPAAAAADEHYPQESGAKALIEDQR